jgi:hypothetical protein
MVRRVNPSVPFGVQSEKSGTNGFTRWSKKMQSDGFTRRFMLLSYILDLLVSAVNDDLGELVKFYYLSGEYDVR